MRILLLEDNQERIEFFKRIFRNHELIICELIFSAQEIVQQEEFDIMFLDHDLYKDNIRGIELEITGYDFVKFLVKNNLQKHSLIYIHSMNPTGANAMQNLLRDNGYEVLWIPFHLLKLEDR